MARGNVVGRLIAVAGAWCWAGAAMATATRFDIPPGRLADTVAALGVQAGVTIGIADPDLFGRASPGVRGGYALPAALARILRGTGAMPVFVAPGIVRIAPRPLPTARPHPPRPPIARDPGTTSTPQDEIVVMASKRQTPYARYPGSVDILDPIDRTIAAAGRGTEAITAALPVVASTSLGPGREKLFIRGVADSSFNGPTQGTVGQYLGDVRLTYNAPDPDLDLYDMQRIEVLAGPQGTLYGTGTLGGIIRLIPTPPDLTTSAATIAVGGSTVAHGGSSGDGSAMLNLPLRDNRIGVRVVAFGSHDPGYIDDPGRGLRDINSGTREGGRATLRFANPDGWSVDLGAAIQNIASRDGQYTLRGAPPLTRSSRIAQPFDNDYRLGYVALARTVGTTDIVATTSIVRHDVTSVFDASAAGDAAVATRFRETNAITLLAHETRAARTWDDGSLVAGVSALYDLSRLTRTLGPIGDEPRIAGVRNENGEAAIFGEYTRRVRPDLSATIGGRIMYSRSLGSLLDRPAEDDEARRSRLRFVPSIAVAWTRRPDLLLFARYQEGARAGGVAVAPAGTGDGVAIQRYDTDHLRMAELGARFGIKDRTRLSGSATLSLVRWEHLQADLIDGSGLPYTANIGTGRIIGLDGQIAWRVLPMLTIRAAVFVNQSALFAPALRFAASDERELPNIAEAGGQMSLAWHRALSPSVDLSVDGSARYVGRSQLGIGAPLDVSQGRYLTTALGGRLGFGWFGMSLDVTNLGDVRGNRFAYGNPFGLAARNEITPLRPRTIRIGADARF